MRVWWCASFTGAALLALPSGVAVAQGTPPSGNVRQAHVAWTSNAGARCPDLHRADDGPIAEVVFFVSAYGVPSQPSIKTSSGSESLDAAALSCVMKLRFQAATRAGDGVAVDSWQQMGWRWVSHPQRPVDAAPTTTGASASASASAPAPPLVVAPASDLSANPPGTSSRDHRAEVRVCADHAGKLAQDPTILRSSGDPGFDEAALRIAKAGSGYYRPATIDGKTVSGCMQLTIQPEMQ